MVKRYGYKFLEPSGDSAKFTNLRATSIIGAFAVFVVNGLSTNSGEWAIFILLALPYYAFFMVAEEFPTAGLGLAALLSLTLSGLSLYFWLSTEPAGRWELTGLAFLLYNLVIASQSIFAIWVRVRP